MAESYDMRSNLKNKPGAQGTLFKVQDKGLLNPQQRWPQGYTPERLNDVRGALQKTVVTPPEHMYSAPDDEMQAEHGTNVFGYRDRVSKSIAQTTVPTTHLAGIKEIHGEPAPGSSGTYWHNAKTIAVDLSKGDPNDWDKEPHTREDKIQTLVHEIGHHVHNALSKGEETMAAAIAPAHARKALEGNEYRSEPNTSDLYSAKSRVRRGVGEALADDYLTEHYKSASRKPVTTDKGAYEHNFSAHEREREYPGYNDVRPPQNKYLQSSQFDQGQPEMISRLRVERDQERAGHQTPLSRRLAARADATKRAVGENL